MNDNPPNPQTERQFLHDVSNVLALAHGHLHILIRGLQSNPGDFRPEDMLPRLESAMSAVNRLSVLIHGRREEIS